MRMVTAVTPLAWPPPEPAASIRKDRPGHRPHAPEVLLTGDSGFWGTPGHPQEKPQNEPWSDGGPVFKRVPKGARLLGEASLQPLKHHAIWDFWAWCHFLFFLRSNRSQLSPKQFGRPGLMAHLPVCQNQARFSCLRTWGPGGQFFGPQSLAAEPQATGIL